MASVHPGTRVGAYVIESLIDQGGFSFIYRARSLEGGALVAVKVLLAELAVQPDLVLRFERELEAATRLRHPNIVQIFDQGRLESGQPILPFISSEVSEAGPSCRRDREQPAPSGGSRGGPCGG